MLKQKPRILSQQSAMPEAVTQQCTMPEASIAPSGISISNRLAVKTILVTGAGGVIGLETSVRLLQEGAQLSLVDINPGTLKKAVSKLSESVPTEY